MERDRWFSSTSLGNDRAEIKILGGCNNKPANNALK